MVPELRFDSSVYELSHELHLVLIKFQVLYLTLTSYFILLLVGI